MAGHLFVTRANLLSMTLIMLRRPKQLLRGCTRQPDVKPDIANDVIHFEEADPNKTWR